MTPQEQESRAPVLAAFSPQTAAKEPLEFGLAASERTGAPLIIVAVHPGGPVLTARGADVEEGDEKRTLEHLRLGLQRRGLRDVEVKVVQARTVAAGLTRAVEEHKPELVVLGSAHRGRLGSVLLGSTAEQIIHESGSPVVVVPGGYERPEGGVSVVGAAFAPTEEGAETLRAAAGLARALGVRLRAISVLDQADADAQEDTQARARDALGELAEGIELDTDLRTGDPADGLAAASQEVDLLVMGSSGRGSRRSALLGGASREVAGKAACPVLILRRHAKDSVDALIGNVEPPTAG